MEVKSFIAGILAAYGLVNLLGVFGIGLYIALPLLLFGVNIGNIILALIALLVAFYLVKN
jgi:hypothetical protein